MLFVRQGKIKDHILTCLLNHFMINFILCHGEIQIFIILIRSNNIYELTEISCKENILI
jgi:hypothetical protein